MIWGNIRARKACPLLEEAGPWESGLQDTQDTFLIQALSREGVWSLRHLEPAAPLPAFPGRFLTPCPAPGQGPQPSAARKQLVHVHPHVPDGEATPERGKNCQFAVEVRFVSGIFFLPRQSYSRFSEFLLISIFLTSSLGK